MCVSLALAASASIAGAQQGAVDLEGHAVNPFTAGSNKVVVLVFLRRDCPVSGRYAPSIQQISRRNAASASNV